MRLRALLLPLAVLAFAPVAQAELTSSDFTTVQLPGSDNHTEPRIAVDQNDDLWAVTNGWNQDVYVYSSHDHGQSFQKAPATFSQTAPTIDVDVVAMNLGQSLPRIFASELDTGGLNFPSGYTDDGGKTWHDSQGALKLADQDRQWFAVGPKDPLTGKPRVYLLFHNLASGVAQHNMWVSTSIDGGDTFGPPVPIATPGSDAYQDLQCSDSGGPSNITVNPKTGRIYAFFTTRAAPDPAKGAVDTGGCGASVFGPLEFNIVNGTRVWVASSPSGLPGTWTDALAVDDSKTQQVVSMQLAYGALDNKGNVYVAYPESPNPYPDLTGAGVKLVWQQPDADGQVYTGQWSKPVTLVPATPGFNGANLVHLVAGDPGKVAVAYFKGQDGGPNNDPAPVWYSHVVESLDVFAGDDAHTTDVDVSNGIPSYTWSASGMMGICKITVKGNSLPTDKADGVTGGLLCDRSTDVWGIDMDKECRVTSVWPTGQGGAEGDEAGTYVTTQQSGQRLCEKNWQNP